MSSVSDPSQSHQPGAGEQFQLRVVDSLRDVDKESWERLAGTRREQKSSLAYNPFVSFAYLESLEEAGCACAETGWLGQHLLLETGENELLGALPCYLKNHSQGEYVFDHGWADAYERAGGHYYPKLQASVPFTPATGPRLLALERPTTSAIQTALAGGLKTLTDRHGLSSAHVTFVPEAESAIFASEGYLNRTDQQFHFTNNGYENYGQFLETLASRKRKALKKERRVALENDISVDWLTGSELTESVWDTFF